MTEQGLTPLGEKILKGLDDLEAEAEKLKAKQREQKAEPRANILTITPAQGMALKLGSEKSQALYEEGKRLEALLADVRDAMTQLRADLLACADVPEEIRDRVKGYQVQGDKLRLELSKGVGVDADPKSEKSASP